MIELIYGWGDIDNDCNLLASLLTVELLQTARVVAIGNDLIPATLIASRLNLPVIQISKVGDIPMISNPLQSGDGTLPDLPKLIFVVSYASLYNYEEINNLAARFTQVGHEVIIIALFSSQGSAHKFIYQQFVQPNTNITFPWKL